MFTTWTHFWSQKENKTIAANQNWCLSFDYNMFGKKMGELIIRSGASGSTVERWRMTGNQGRNWLQARIDVPAEQNLVVSLFDVYNVIYVQ